MSRPSAAKAARRERRKERDVALSSRRPLPASPDVSRGVERPQVLNEAGDLDLGTWGVAPLRVLTLPSFVLTAPSEAQRWSLRVKFDRPGLSISRLHADPPECIQLGEDNQVCFTSGVVQMTLTNRGRKMATACIHLVRVPAGPVAS